MGSEVHVDDLIPAFVLGVLENEEAGQVATHVETCFICRETLLQYRQLAGQMAFAAPQVAPPPRVKAALMARVQPMARQQPPEGHRASWFEGLRAAFARQSPALALVSLVLVLFLAASNLLLWRQVRDLQSARPMALKTIDLTGTAFAPQASGMIVVSTDGSHGTLVVDDLPQLREAQQYQLWLIRDGQRVSGGVFDVSREGYGSVWIESPEPLADYQSFGITIEPVGGSSGPTGEKVLGGDL